MSNTDWSDKDKRYNRSIQDKYGISLHTYNKMLEEQGGVCAVCMSYPHPNNGRLCVDHDHVTGKVRGLLCNQCNTMLGLANDDPEILIEGAKYLDRNKVS